jgi:2-methylfumaryl-CoA isomerase
MNYGLLPGVRIIESSAFIAAPLAGLALAQFGADVIRVDLPGGGIDYARMPLSPAGRSLYWTGLNKGKRSLAIDFRRPEGRELVQALVTCGDTTGGRGGILLTNIGTPWLAHDLLAKRRADLISCTIEGNPDGSNAVDYTVNCATGFPYMTGNASADAPVNHALPAWDIACAYHAAFSVAAALARRTARGEGAELRLALSDVAFSMLSHLGISTQAEVLREDRAPIGNYLYGAFGRDFGTADGRRIYLAGVSSNQWKALVRATGTGEQMAEIGRRLGLDFTVETDRFAARETIAGLLEPWIAARSFGEIGALFDAGGVAWGPYRTVRQALREDARLSAANPLFDTIDTPGVGRHLAAGTPLRLIGEERGATRAAPLLGADTDSVLQDVLGLDAAALGRLHDAGIVAGPGQETYGSRNAPARPAAARS